MKGTCALTNSSLNMFKKPFVYKSKLEFPIRNLFFILNFSETYHSCRQASSSSVLLVVLEDLVGDEEVVAPEGDVHEVEDHTDGGGDGSEGSGENLNNDHIEEWEDQGSETEVEKVLVAAISILPGGDEGTNWAEEEVEDQADKWEGSIKLSHLGEGFSTIILVVVEEGLFDLLEVVVFSSEHILFFSF